MKKFLFILGFSCMAGAAGAQQVYDANHVLKGYITKQGVVQDKNGVALCSFMMDGRIVDPKANTLGFLVNEYEMQDKNHKTVGFFKPDGTIEDSKHVVMAHMPHGGSGPITNAQNATIGHIEVIEPVRAAAYFFILKY